MFSLTSPVNRYHDNRTASNPDMATYFITAKGSTTQRDLERLRRTLTDLSYGQIARYAATSTDTEHGVEVVSLIDDLRTARKAWNRQAQAA